MIEMEVDRTSETNAEDVMGGADGADGAELRLRSYQSEMVEKSLEENILVAMDTGSGKTHIALSRTATELEQCDPSMLVWFLAPTVALCEQQYQMFTQYLPCYQSLMLSGDQNIEAWSDQATWDALLKNVRIVISTHAILLDALSNAFVKLAKLSLLIFDEAHHCTGNHPANQIMRYFYAQARKNKERDVPRILGLSASPVVNAKADSLDTIETNLDSRAVSPKLCRTELLKYVHRPKLIRLTYPEDHSVTTSGPLHVLQNLFSSFNILHDPYVCELRSMDLTDPAILGRLQKTILTKKTYCHEQLKMLVRRAGHVNEEIGAWAANWYIGECIRHFQTLLADAGQLIADWTEKEKTFLSTLLGKVSDAKSPGQIKAQDVSEKTKALIDLLVTDWSPEVRGIVFVQQRATASALAQLLCLHDATKSRYQVVPFVGTSASSKRKANVADLFEGRTNQDSLDGFRQGQKNLIIATSVLEEGIDISSCNIVVCFEAPQNLKSFIQRRGRARKLESKFVVMLPGSLSSAKGSIDWEHMEELMKQQYLDDSRSIEVAKSREERREPVEQHFSVQKTGAILTSQNATQRLNHFCAVLKPGPYIDARPQYSFQQGDDADKLINAKVILPIFVDAEFRSFESAKRWSSERNASQDAAFQACLSLHRAGLLNDHLLPALHIQDPTEAGWKYTERHAMFTVQKTLNPWAECVPGSDGTSNGWQRMILRLYSQSKVEISSMNMYLPTRTDVVPPITLHWNQNTKFLLECIDDGELDLSESDLDSLRFSTHVLLRSIFASRMADDVGKYVILLAPLDVQIGGLKTWAHSMEGGKLPAAVNVEALAHAPYGVGLIRQASQPVRPFFLHQADLSSSATESSKTSGENASESKMMLRVSKFPKRRDFLHRPANLTPDAEADYTTLFDIDASDCMVDRLPAAYSVMALFAPTLIYKLESSLVAASLYSSLLQNLFIKDRSLIISAITASSAHDQVNYQVMEFIGDCVLKYCTSISLMALHPQWPEKYLTHEKGRTNCNPYLAEAAKRIGLESYIVTAPLSAARWRPKCFTSDDAGESSPEKRKMSGKTLADVVESLIGASYVDGGITKAETCIALLLPAEKWIRVESALNQLFEGAANPETSKPSQTIEKLGRELIGHNFAKPMLLQEAMTHPSYSPRSISGEIETSYQRLEFLGDAVLDLIVVRNLTQLGPDLAQAGLHGLRTAIVNAYILAFLCIEFSVPESKVVVGNDVPQSPQDPPKLKEEVVRIGLWAYMRKSSFDLTKVQQKALERHRKQASEVLRDLKSSRYYPWVALEHCGAEKFFSDLVESVLGAIFIDTKGDLIQCEKFLDRLGLMGLMKRLVEEKVDIVHPKERLGRVADAETVTYVRTQLEGPGYSCIVRIGGRQVGEGAGVGRNDAETAAAKVALQRLGAHSVESWPEVEHDSAGD